MSYWRKGDAVVLRNIARSDGTVTTAVPALCLGDSDRSLAAYIAKGTAFKNNYAVPTENRVDAVSSALPSARREHKDLTWWQHTVRIYLPAAFYSVSFFYDEQWELRAYYGNLEAPFVRTPIGVDTRDYALDLVATPSGEWSWKDEAEFARRLAVGTDSAEHQARIRAAGTELAHRLERNKFPFNREWQVEVPKHFPVPELPANWAQDYATHSVLSAYAA